ncbi:hypothetical protein [Portibacter lacus]|uniref:Uncharacterized protein n=1 Tax=Portibacter lacus TaxID=1099794 RepID=A0AA37SYG6_9BACT|nr:hypothetical protein [Portibacter lacus]GLR19953.1 hypothetical protein GCM10007940_45690 [Portibacter lacus]
MKLIISFTIIFTLLYGHTNAQSFPETFDFGTTESDSYQNDFFKMEITFDSTWVIQDRRQMNSLVKTGGEIVAGDDEMLKSVVKASMVNTAYLLTIFKYEVGAPVEFNPSFLVVAENTINFPGIKKGSDYLFHSKKLLQQSQVPYTFDKDIFQQQVGSIEFYVMEAKVDYLGNTIVQDYMTAVINGFSLTFILSYTNEDEKSELYDILEHIMF